VNTVLGEEWEEEADVVPDWTRLYERREDWPHLTVPRKGLYLTAGADVQADRIELDVWAWGRGLESWLVEHLVLWGDPGKRETFAQLNEVLGRTWEHAGGQRMVLQRLAIDSGAFTQQVYQWVRTQSRAVVLAVKGVPQYDRTVPVSGPSLVEVQQNGVKVKRGVGVWTVSVSFFKRELYKQLALVRPTDAVLAEQGYPAGYVHFPHMVGDEWCQQLVAEQMVIVRSRRGWAVRTEWRQLRPRNEALDMRVYARAAIWLAGADRWPESYWADLERQLDLRGPEGEGGPAPDGPIQPPPPPPAPVQQPRRPIMVRSLGRRW
jgi:phage terminase large subunit GpA-like protein